MNESSHLKYFCLHSTDHVIKALTNRNASATITEMHGDRNHFPKVRKMMVPETGPFGRVTSSTGRWSTWYNQQQRGTGNFPLLQEEK